MKIFTSLKLPAFFILFFLAAAFSVTTVNAQNFRASASAGATSGTLSLTITKPTGTVSSDVMIAAISVTPSSATITAPAGWTLIRRTNQPLGTITSAQATFWKAAGASEPVSYTWTFNSSTGTAGGISAFYNINNPAPINIENGQATGSALTHATPDITTTVANTMIITTHSVASCATWTAPSGMTEAVDKSSNAAPLATGISIEMNYVTQPAAGATGVMTATASNDADYGVTQILSLVSNSSATIVYPGSPYCSSSGTATVTQTGTAGGTYSSAAGLSINSTTGDVNLSASTPGSYTVTYTYAGSYTKTTNIIITLQPFANGYYPSNPYCTNIGTTYPTGSSVGLAGILSSTAGLSINASTGAVNLSASAAGTYTITYTVPASGGCAVYSNYTIISISTAPSATISYTASPYCMNIPTIAVTATGTTGGVYSSTPGLTINSTTGEITSATSTAGTYTVKYTIAAAAGCATYTASTTVILSAVPSATINYPGTPYCSNSNTASVTRTGTAGGVYSSTTGLSINAITGVVTLGTSTAGTYLVTYTINAAGCSMYTTTASITIKAAANAIISYDGSPYQRNGGTAVVNFSGTTGGIYSSTAGLSINAASGDVTLATSLPATYIVTYTIAAAGGCAIYTKTASITVIITTKIFTGNGNFSDATKWTSGTLPVAGENLLIDGACTVDNNAGTDNIAYGTLIIGTSAARTLNWASAGTNRLNVSNVSAGSTTSILDMTNGGILIIRGTWASSNLSFIAGAGMIEIRSILILPVDYTTYNNLSINGPGITVKLSVGTAIMGNLTIATGIFNTNNFNLSVAGNWTNNVSTAAFTGTTSTVSFNGTLAQSIGGSSATVFNNLTISNTGNIVTLLTNATIAGNLTVSAGTFNLAAFTANRSTAGGILTVSNNATIQIGGTNTYPTNYSTSTLIVASTVEYSGTNQTVSSQTYGNLKLSSSAGAAVKTLPVVALTILGNLVSTVGAGTSVSFTATTAVNVSGNVSIGASTTFNGGASFHAIGGNWTNDGTFNGSTGSVSFTGPGAQIGGSGIQNFNNLYVAASLVVFSNSSIGVSGNLASTGSGSFSQVPGGTFTMTGSGKAISGSGISLNNLIVSGVINSLTSFIIGGDLSVSGSMIATSGTITMNGISKTISGAGTKTFSVLSVTGSVTTNANFSISSGLIVTGSLTASAGTATFTGTSTLSGTANLFNTTINGTSLQLSANATLGIANLLTITAGNLNATSTMPNTVNFNGTGSQNINALTYCNLILSNGNTKTALGSITTTYNITIGTGTTFNPFSYTHSVYGSWINNGTFIPGTSTVAFAGPSTAYITGATTFNILTSNTSGATTELILNDNIAATTVNMINGIISTGSDTITITGTRTGNGYIYGNIRRNHVFTTGVAYAFEGPDNTITFSAVSSVNSITVSVVEGSVSDFPYATAISRVYNIAVPSGTYTATLRLHYEDDELNGNQEANMGIWSNDGTVVGWIPVGKTGNSTVSNYVEQSGITNLLNRWTCSINPSVVLWNGSVSTDWNNPSNWTVYVGAASAPPSANDVAVLGGIPFTYQPTINTTVNVKNVVFVATQAVDLSMASGGSLTSGDILGVWSSNATHTINVNDQSVTVNGQLSLSDSVIGHAINLNIGSGTVNITGKIHQSGGANIVFAGPGNLNIGGDFDYVGGTFTSGTGTVTYNGIENQDIGTVNYNNLVINNAAAVLSINDTINIGGNLSMLAGEVDNYSYTNIAGNVNISSGATIHNHNLLHVGGNWNNSGNYVGTGAEILFNGSGTQTISATTFNNIVINKPVGSSAILTGNISINGDLTITSGTFNIKTFDCNRSIEGGTITMADSATFIVGANNSPLNFSSGTLATSSTVIADGTVPQLIFGLEFGNLIFRNAGTKTLVSPITVKGDLIIENGTSFDAGAQTLTLDGNWINNGTFIPSTSTIVCTGTAKNFIGNNTFKRLSVYGSYTFVNNNTIDSLLIINSTGSLSGGSTITTIMNGDLINKGVLYTLGSTTFTGNVLQTLSLINAVQTVAMTVNFNGSVSPVLNSTSAPQFGFLNINNTGGVNPSVGWTILYGLTVGSGASFNGGNSNHNILGYLTNNGTITSSGTLNFIPASAKTINLGSNFSSTGLVNFGGTGAITIAGNPSGSFHDVLVSNSNAAGISPSSAWNISNNFNVNSGSIFSAGNYIHTIAGNILNNGTINSGTSTFTLSGTGSQDIYSNSAFNNITINKASGATTQSSNITVNGVLNFVAGKIQTGNNVFIQPSSGAITGAAQNTGWIDGALQKNVTTGAVTKTFELGDDNYYTPLSIAFGNVSNAGDLKIKSIPGDHPAINSSSINAQKTVNRYWNFINTGIAFTTYNATLSYPSSDIDAGATPSSFGAGIYTGSSWQSPATGLMNDTSAHIINADVFGDVEIGEICNKGTSIQYALSPYCSASGTASVTLTGNGGGTYSSASGLSINTATGLVTPGTSVPGTYIVTYSISATGECPSYITTASITINPAPYATSSYTASPYCSGAGIVYPSVSGNVAGVFSSTTGLVIDSITGAVDLAASTLGTYTVTYTIAASGGCDQFQANTDITIITPGTWTGLVNDDWNNSGNWLCGGIPTASTNVTIPSGSTNLPLITSVQPLNNLVIQPGAAITISGGTLQIAGSIANSGMLDVSGGTIEMIGSSAQTISANAFSNHIIKNLIISNDVSMAEEDTLTGTLTIAAGKTFTTNDYLILRSDANGTARIATLPTDGSGNATAFITGKVNIERYIPMRKAWRLLSAPVKTSAAPTINSAWQEGVGSSAFVANPNPGYGVFIQGGTAANGFDQGLTVSPFVKVYNNVTNTFTGLPAIPGTFTPITSYPGYFLYVRGDRSIDLMQGANAATTATTLRMKGQINTGSQATVVNATNYTILGNPFPSAIDFGTLTRNNVKNSFYVWDPKLAGANGLGAYVTFSWNSGTGMYDATTSVSPLSKYIPSGEAVFIESADGINPGTITIKESDKSAGGSDAVFGRTNGLNQKVRVDMYSVNADSTTSLLDGILTTYDDDMLNSIDNDDAKKLNGGSENIGIKRNNTMLSIERRKTITANDTTFLNIYQMKIHDYQFEVGMNNLYQTGTTAIIKDSYSNTNNDMPLDMNGTTKIRFSINSDPASYATNRFSIVFRTNVVLPVTIKSVKAYKQQKDIAVEWTTENEINMKQYEVEKSADGRNFTKINTTATTATNGGSAAYKIIDSNPFEGDNYYRIHSVEQSGSAEYSIIVKVHIEIEKDAPSFTVYPNPVKGNTISLHLNNIEKGIYTMELFNLSGQVVAVKQIQYDGSTAEENIQIEEKFAAGKYQLKLTGDNIKLTMPVIKQ